MKTKLLALFISGSVLAGCNEPAEQSPLALEEKNRW